MENSKFKLYIRNFINISSYNSLDAIYTEISRIMKSIHSLGWKSLCQCGMLPFGKIDTVGLISATVAQWLTCSPLNLKVAGSSLPMTFIFFNKFFFSLNMLLFLLSSSYFCDFFFGSLFQCGF